MNERRSGFGISDFRIQMRPVIVLMVAVMALCVAAPDLMAQSFGERDTGFKIALSYRTEPPAGIQAEIVTTSTYPCEGYTIRSQVTWDRDTVNINIVNFIRPSPCLQLGGEAQGTAFLGNLRDATYVIRVYYRGDSDLHRVTFWRRRITTSPIRNDFTQLASY